jgi:hypothetical protein
MHLTLGVREGMRIVPRINGGVRRYAKGKLEFNCSYILYFD